MQAGSFYNVMQWDKSRTVETVKFVYFINAAHEVVKTPAINTMKPGDLLQFLDSTGRPFVAEARDCAITCVETGKRLTFSRIDGDVAADVADEPVGVVVGEVELTVEECKLARKRRLDAERKRAARAAAKVGTVAADEVLAA